MLGSHQQAHEDSFQGVDYESLDQTQSTRREIKMPQFDYEPAKYTGPSLEEMKAKRAQYVSPANFMFYRNPIMIVDGNMQYLYDQDGKQYLDYFAGISTVGVGHCHPRVTSKIKE